MTFAQQQKLSLIQPELKPISNLTKKKLVKTKKRKQNKNLVPFCIGNIFKLANELINEILNNFKCDIHAAKTLLNLRLVNKETRVLVDKYCYNQCRNITFIPKINPTKYYFNKLHNNHVKISNNEIIYYNKIQCDDCNNNKNGLYIKLNGKYICAFQCKDYYCYNRSCYQFGIVNTFYGDCRHKCQCCLLPLHIYKKGLDHTRCTQNDNSAPEHSKCLGITQDGNGEFLKNYSCKDCHQEFTKSMYDDWDKQTWNLQNTDDDNDDNDDKTY